MKKPIILFLVATVCTLSHSQNSSGKNIKSSITKYETFIYTSNNLDKLIQDEYKKSGVETRGFLSDLGNATLGGVKGIGGGYISAIIDLGVNSIASLITKPAKDRQKWEDIIKIENIFQETIGTVETIHNFYSKPSFNGPMDPLE